MSRLNQLMTQGLGMKERLVQEAEPMAKALAERGWFTLDGLLGDNTCEQMRAETMMLRRNGCFSQSYSEIAETGERIWRPGVFAMELDGESWRSAPLTITFVNELMRELPPVLNDSFRERGLLLSSSVFGHKIAISEGDGSNYPKHLDNVAGPPNDKRKVTAIYYANQQWDDANGGVIRLYDQLDEPLYTDISPQGDRLLVFWSDLLVHEVLPSWKSQEDAHRCTLTVWLTSDNPQVLLDGTDPLHALRTAHFPNR